MKATIDSSVKIVEDEKIEEKDKVSKILPKKTKKDEMIEENATSITLPENESDEIVTETTSKGFQPKKKLSPPPTRSKKRPSSSSSPKVQRDPVARETVPYRISSLSDVYCNRELNMGKIQIVGFDMDYTLAAYKKEFDLIAYEGAKDKLINWLGYPAEDIQTLIFEENMCQRGNLIDTQRGNILKLDQHRYVHVVEHGTTRMPSEIRKEIYRESYQEAENFINNHNFQYIDTPYTLIDACLYAQLVNLRDKKVAVATVAAIAADADTAQKEAAEPLLDTASAATFSATNSSADTSSSFSWEEKDYPALWSDLRKCIDRCHKDGVIKLAVAENPSKYIKYDPKLFGMLKKLQKSGIKLFLLTNSLWEYTQVVMNYLQGKKEGEEKDLEWTKYFDLIFVGGNKPSFILDGRASSSFFRINATSGGLQYIDTCPKHPVELFKFLKEGKIFQGGNAQILHQMLANRLNQAEFAGDHLLYVGDHIYADVLRSKRSLGWRTCLIVPELEHEMKMHLKNRIARKEVKSLRKLQFEYESIVDEITRQLYQAERQLKELYNRRRQQEEGSGEGQKSGQAKQNLLQLLVQEEQVETEQATASAELATRDDDDVSILVARNLIKIDIDEEISHLQTTIQEYKQEIQQLSEQIQLIRLEIKEKLSIFNTAFHHRWGQLFKAKFQESFLSKQIKDFACIYTSKPSNLREISLRRSLQPVLDKMPHDHIIDRLIADLGSTAEAGGIEN